MNNFLKVGPLIAAKLRKYEYRSLFPNIFRKNYVSFDSAPANELHAIAIVVIWGLLYCILLFGLKYGFASLRLASLLKWLGLIFNLSGTVWIIAGVIYVRPTKKATDLAALEKHVTDTFASASRHCCIGVTLFLIGVSLQVLADERFVIALQ
ncbi:hypothetical protein [Massilia sp. TSP1-1-2]|uniref:hypothetical protein n=1 Tax=Massilia sp. TSP1-1-2 TaxID=2804649 RepID=UPI003CFBB592